jgi:hypothetical protein
VTAGEGPAGMRDHARILGHGVIRLILSFGHVERGSGSARGSANPLLFSQCFARKTLNKWGRLG